VRGGALSVYRGKKTGTYGLYQVSEKAKCTELNGGSSNESKVPQSNSKNTTLYINKFYGTQKTFRQHVSSHATLRLLQLSATETTSYPPPPTGHPLPRADQRTCVITSSNKRLSISAKEFSQLTCELQDTAVDISASSSTRATFESE
jgi:hypothetical protein